MRQTGEVCVNSLGDVTKHFAMPKRKIVCDIIKKMEAQF